MPLRFSVNRCLCILFASLAVIPLLLLFTGCENEKVSRDYPRVRTLDVVNITADGATFMADIFDAGSVPVTEHGFTWSTRDPVLDLDEKIHLGSFNGTGKYEANVTAALREGIDYTVSAFVKAGDYTVYGNRVTFRSLGSKGPVITGFSPASAVLGDTLLIRGRNFSWQSASNIVRFNETTAALCMPATDTTLYVIVPVSLSQRESFISVEIAGNRATFTESPLLVDLPVLESFFPTEARWGDTVEVEIFCRNMKDGSSYYFLAGRRPVQTVKPYDGTSVTVAVPVIDDPGEIAISLAVGEAQIPAPGYFTILPPVVNGFTPATAFINDTVALHGHFFPALQGTSVLFGPVAARVVSVTRNIIRVIVPEAVPRSPVQLTYRRGEVECSSADRFSLAPPEIHSISSLSGHVGDIITITGKGFINGIYTQYFSRDDVTAVLFNNVRAYSLVVNSSTIQCEVPGNLTGEATLKIVVEERETLYDTPFMLTNPAVLSVSPSTGSPGDIITITGVHLGSTSFIRLMPYDNGMSIVSRDENEIRAILPSFDYTSGTVSALLHGYYSDSRIGSAPVTILKPEIHSVSPLSGRAGTPVTMTGRNFSTVNGYNRVSFNGVEAEVTSSTRTSVTFVMPATEMATEEIELRVCGHTVLSSDRFEYISPWSRLPNRPVGDMEIMMNFGSELIAIGSNGVSYSYYRFDPSSSLFSILGSHRHWLYPYGKAVIKGGRAFFFHRDEPLLIEFDPATLSISTVTTRPGSSMHNAILLDGDSVLYAGGGSGVWYNSVTEFWKYRPGPGTWHRLNDLPFNGYWPTHFTINGRSFVLALDGKLWEYDCAADSWLPRASYPGRVEEGMLCIAVGGKGFAGNLDSYTLRIYSYDPVADSWSSLSGVVPPPRVMPFAFEYNGMLYYTSARPLYEAGFWLYNPALE